MTFPYLSLGERVSVQGVRLAGLWLGFWPLQRDLRLFALGAFTVENLPAEAETATANPKCWLSLRAFLFYVLIIIISYS